MARPMTIDIDGPVHYVDYGGDGPPMVLVHGLGGSHLNWLEAAPLLAESHRVLAPDLSGFGLTPPAGRGSGVSANRTLVEGFLRRVAPGGDAVVIGNSMGGLVTMMLAASTPELVSRAVLVTPALPPSSVRHTSRETLVRLGLPLLPIVGPRIAARYRSRVSLGDQMNETLEMLCVDPGRVSREFRDASLRMARKRLDMEWDVPAFVEASRSIAAVLARRRRFIRMVHRISCPVLVVHGEHDPIVRVESARWLESVRPDFDFVYFPDAGHIPHVETAEAFAGAVRRFLHPVPA